MTGEDIFTLILLAVIVVVCSSLGIIALIQHLNYKKMKSKYHKIFETIAQRDKIDSCSFYNKNIYPLKKSIEQIWEEKKYMTREHAAIIEQQEEEIKRQLEIVSQEYNKLRGLEDDLRVFIRDAILDTQDKKFIKMMKGLNWFRED